MDMRTDSADGSNCNDSGRLPATMIRAIAFDLWETLITNTPEVTRAHRRLRLERLGRILRDSSAERIEAAYRASWDRCHQLYWSSDRDVPCRRQIEHFLEELGSDPKSIREPMLAALEEAWATVAVEVPPVIVPGAEGLVRDLKRRGFRLGLISNTGRTPGSALRTILAQLDLAPLFDAMVFSNEHGECKPKRSIFESLRRSMGVEFEEMLFVGDNLYVDVYGAQQCGVIGIHFIPPVRGTAVAPPVHHQLEIEPHATIRDLAELPAILDAL